MKRTQRAIIDAAYAMVDDPHGAGRYELTRAVDADRANTEPEPEVMTPEAKALIDAAIKWRPASTLYAGNMLRHTIDAYLASLKPRLEVPWPDAIDTLRRARFAEMRRQYPDASDADIDAALDAFAKDGAK